MEVAADAKSAWANVRNDKHPAHWCVIRVSDDNKSLILSGSGTGGLNEFRDALKAQSGILYGGFRCNAVDKRGSVTSVRYRFLLVSLITEDVPPLKRAKAGAWKGFADTLFAGTSVYLNVSTADDVTEEAIIAKLEANAGAHRPSGYEFLGAESPSNKLKDGGENEPVPEETAAPPPPPPAPTESAPPPPPPPAASTVDLKSLDVRTAWKRVQDEKGDLNWMMATYDGKNVSSATLFRAGSGGLREFKENLDDSMVIFGGLRCKAIDDRGSVQSVRTKLIFVQFIGSQVKPTVRAQAGPAKGHFEAMLSGTHIGVGISNADELREEDLITKLQASCGAHRPTGYDFS